MKLPKQRNIPWLGALVDSLYTALPILSIINFLSIITVLYATIRGNLFQWAPWLTFGWFIGIMVILTITLIALMYVFVVPSIWTFRGKQMYGFESELMKEVKALREEIKEMKKEVNMDKEEYCVDCNDEVAVRLEDCPAYKAKTRKRAGKEELEELKEESK